jgi:ribonuclease P protein component
MGETDVPAEQPETQEEARLPSPDAQSSGPRGDSTPAHQGPLQAFRLIWRVRGQASFRALARGRRRAAGDLEVRTVVLGSSEEPPRVAYAVGKAVGNAVTRNRVRRKLRAATIENAELLERGSGYLVRARPGATATPTTQLAATLRAILRGFSETSR